jgi:hypothetical protein
LRQTRLAAAAAASVALLGLPTQQAVAGGTAPTWTDSTPAIVPVVGNQVVTLTLTASDADAGDTVHVEPVSGPAYARLVTEDGNPAVATVTVTAPRGIHGRIRLVVRARDAGGNAVLRELVLDAKPDTTPVSLVGPGEATRWAYVLARATARSAPRATAHVVARVPTSTSLGSPNLVSVLQERYDAGGTLWVEANLAALPNGTTGWIRRSDLDAYHVVKTHLWIDRSRLTARLTRNGVEVFRSRVGVGRGGTPTPGGTFYVRERLRGFDDPAYGPIAFGISARSATLTDWPGGGFVGIHGTNMPQLVPGRISHGCIRMRNADILRLARVLALGTPVTIS